MVFEKEIVVAASLALSVAAGPRSIAADDLKTVLHKLDAAAPNFHSTSADFEFDTNQTDRFPTRKCRRARSYYERKGRLSRWRRTSMR